MTFRTRNQSRRRGRLPVAAAGRQASKQPRSAVGVGTLHLDFPSRMYPAPLRRGLPFLAYGNQLFFRCETVWVLGGQRSTPPGTTIAAYMTSRPDLGERWPSRLVATAASANCLTLNRLAIDTFRQVLMVGEWGTLLPVLRCPARLFATVIEGLILPEPSEPTRRQRARVRG